MRREFYHAIPLRYRDLTQKDNVLLVGDAAGQVKATTGGGIVFGSLCAKIAAVSAKNYLDGKNLDYEKSWKSRYGRALDAHRAVRTLLDNLPPSVVSLGLASLAAVGFSKVLERFGDMDFILKTSQSPERIQ